MTRNTYNKVRPNCETHKPESKYTACPICHLSFSDNFIQQHLEEQHPLEQLEIGVESA